MNGTEDAIEGYYRIARFWETMLGSVKRALWT